jgi:hypothetical protein
VAVLLLLSFSIFQACDDDEPKDTLAPEISITNLTESMNVWNTVTLELTASDNSALSQLELFVDNNLISTDAEDPFEFSWDSNTVADGAHTVKVVATDKSGNASEKSVTVNVLNTLVSFTTGAQQLNMDEDWKERGFVFLSDAEGKVIASQEYSNGSTVTLKSSSFNGEKFFLTEVLIELEDETSFARAWTYTAIERGKKWTLIDDRDNEDESYVGDADLTFINPTADFRYNGYSRDEYIGYGEFGGTSSIRLEKSPALLYLTKYPNDDQNVIAPTYNLYSNIVVGENTINLSLANKALTKVSPAFPSDAIYSSVEIEGFAVANNFSDPYRVDYFSSSDPELTVYYPGSAFPTYSTEIYYETGKIGYSRGTTSMNFSLPAISNNVAFAFNANKLSYTATGNQDLTSIMFFNQEETTYWSIALPQASTSTVIPTIEIPEALKTFDFPSFSLPESFAVYDFEEISGYDDLMNYVRNSTMSIDGLYDAGKNWVDIQYYSSSTNGRMKNTRPSHKSFGKNLKK